MFKCSRYAAIILFAGTAAAYADSGCAIPSSVVQTVQGQLKTVVNLSDANGGIFKPNRMWSAIVDRQGVLCSIKSSAEFAPTLDVLNNSNPFKPTDVDSSKKVVGDVPGGIITFGGGVALYDSKGQVIGALGVSGDSSCADHAIAFRMRALAGYAAVPSGVAPDNTDNIIYPKSGAAPTGFEQPHCFPSDLTPAEVENIPAH
jgi:hypothetical protein